MRRPKQKYLVTYKRRVVEEVTVMYEAETPEQALAIHDDPTEMLGYPYHGCITSNRLSSTDFGDVTVKIAPPICDNCKRQHDDEPACEMCIPY